ncbi:hypothetical protein, partial [Streptomyces katrae]
GKERKSDKETTPKQKEILTNQLHVWWAEQDKTFWDRVSRYCDANNPSVQQMVLEMNMVSDMSQTVSPQWVWARDTDKAGIALGLANQFLA